MRVIPVTCYELFASSALDCRHYAHHYYSRLHSKGMGSWLLVGWMVDHTGEFWLSDQMD